MAPGDMLDAKRAGTDETVRDEPGDGEEFADEPMAVRNAQSRVRRTCAADSLGSRVATSVQSWVENCNRCGSAAGVHRGQGFP